MPDSQPIPIEYINEPNLNGLGKMIGQYLEQNLRDFEKKRRQARKIQIYVAVEVEKEISTSIHFQKTVIQIENGVADNADLHLKASYLDLADMLAGKTNPLLQVLKGVVKIRKIPINRPLQLARLFSFLKIPKELIIDNSAR